MNTSQEPLYTENYTKGRKPEARTTLCASLRNRNALTATFHKSHFIQKFTRQKGRRPEARTTLCASLHSRNHSKFHKSHFIRKFTEKMPRPRSRPNPRTTLCASLHNRNALQHFARATFYGNLQEKCRAPE